MAASERSERPPTLGLSREAKRRGAALAELQRQLANIEAPFSFTGHQPPPDAVIC